MSQNHVPTAPEDRIPVHHMLIYGFGAFVNNLLAAAIGGMSIILNLGFGVDPRLVGLALSLPRITDAFTDPLMGYISDNTRSRWGRRRPYIFGGAILAGLSFIALWQLPEGQSESFYFWVFLGGSVVFYLGYTIFATPWVALGYELTPDYHERTRLMGTQNFIGQTAYVVAPWFLAFMKNEDLHPSLIVGGSRLAIIVGVFTIAVGVLPALLLRERFEFAEASEGAKAEPEPKAPKQSVLQTLGANMTNFLSGFATTLKFRPFLQLCAATFLVFNGFMLISSFQSYVIIYYICGGDQDLGAYWIGWSGSIGAVATFGVVILATALGTRVGKRRAFFLTIGVSIAGYLMKWFCYQPETPWLVVLPAPFIAFGLGSLFTLMPSMVADVVDLDELQTQERREGMFGSIYWWVVKLGMAVALAASGFLLDATGFDVALEGAQTVDTLFWMRVFDVLIPACASLLAIYFVATYPITEARAQEIRSEIEERRGRVAVADSPAPA